jgi:NADH:ubiquinone oxidoreductase subunit E
MRARRKGVVSRQAGKAALAAATAASISFLPASGTTADFDFTVEPVRCLGCCGLAPVVRVDQATFGHLMQSRIPKLLKRYSTPKTEAA